MLKGNRGQGGMEWLMTYGWAILVVITSIAALAYFDLFRIPRLTPNECILPAGIICSDSSISLSKGIHLSITNSMQKKLYGFNVSVLGCSAEIVAAEAGILDESETETFSITCTETLFEGNLFDDNINISYATGQNPLTRLPHSLSGKLTGAVTE
jgi:hypothetical protein